LDPLSFLIFFSYGAVEITNLETNKVVKVNGHRLKPFYEGWTTEFTASVELAEPIYDEWACQMLSQWHKTLRKILCFKCGVIKRILVFFVIFQKNKK
jgi:hypothetical protein